MLKAKLTIAGSNFIFNHINENYKNYAVDVQENDPNSMLNLTRKLIMERKIAT